MASRILTFVSCTIYFIFLVILTAIGLTSIIIGFVGLGLYIPTSINYNSYNSNICFILDHEYDTCQQRNEICFSVMWSVQYIVSNRTSSQYIFSSITQIYDTPGEALGKLRDYEDQNNYTCYYHKTDVTDVKWDRPSSPRPYLIMLIVGFTLTGIFFILIGFIAVYRCTRL